MPNCVISLPEATLKPMLIKCCLLFAICSTCSALRAPMSLSAASQAKHDTATDRSNSLSRRTLLSSSSTAVAGAVVAAQIPKEVVAVERSITLPTEAYTLLGDEMRSCRVLTGLWQLSGAHGFQPQLDPALDAMRKLSSAGFTTFDLVSFKMISLSLSYMGQQPRS
jgi:hypothetical protein